MKNLIFLLVTLAIAAAQDRNFWMTEAQKSVKAGLELKPNLGVAKNVILFLGDGMGVSTITAGRIMKGQLKGHTGEEYRLEMEKFPYAGLIKTYNTNQQTPDSAGTATAFLTGVKTNAGVLGVDESVLKGNCSMLPQGALQSIAEWAHAEGKSVGLVSTARITHATPGAAYAKIPDRDWEDDVAMKDVKNCDHIKDIARQLVEDNSRIQVLMGGGRKHFFNTTDGGNREDGLDLVKLWQKKQNEMGVNHEYVTNNDQFKAVPDDTEHLFGLFSQSHMAYDVDRKETGGDSEPSIEDMFKKAHNILSKNKKGYFLLVEGGRIDHAHHDNLAHKALMETVSFDNAIGAAVELTKETDTLILVTADHSHTFTISGHPKRGHKITEKMGYNEDASKWYHPTDKKPMSILMYANGPGPQREIDLTNVDTNDKDFVFPNGVPTESETHGGEDVAVYALGPMAHLVGGTHEQNVLAHIMGYASCIGPNKDHCGSDGNGSSSSRGAWINLLVGLIVALSFFLRRQ